MIYAISDLHGYPLDRLKMLLEKAGFCDKDFLFIIGDVIDRNGDGGVSILSWLILQNNVQLILGNHEVMLLSCEFLFDEISQDKLDSLEREDIEALEDYLFNGGDVTIRNLQKLNKVQRLEILDYLKDCPIYETVTAGDKDFILVHAGFRDFDPKKKLSDYSLHDLIWTRPRLTDAYYSDIITVLGHTPTVYYGREYRGKVIRTKTWIDIDVGAGAGEEPVLLRLDDLYEFRLTER